MSYDCPANYENAAPELRAWYEKLSQQTGLGVKSVEVCYWTMHYAAKKSQYQRHNDLFYNHTPENRSLLIELADRVAEGEHMPEF